MGIFRAIARSPGAPVAALGALLCLSTVVLFLTDLQGRYWSRITQAKADAQSFAKVLAEHTVLTFEDVDRALLRARLERRLISHDRRRVMPRRPAKVTQADIARAIRAAKQAGAKGVTVDGNGVIRIVLMEGAPPIEPTSDLEEAWVPSEALQRYLKRTESG